jgi:two-component system, chemotaxis family, protein-glutamate methylesterase/glutaminase
MSERIRVLVVDDSALMRKLIPQTLLRDPRIEVVGTAMDGLIGLRKIEEMHPDVVTLDLEMPRMDGMEMLRQITHKRRIPVIVFSAHTAKGADATLKALSLGAFDFVRKPQDAALGQIGKIASELALKIRAAAASGVPKLIIAEPAIETNGIGKLSTGRRWASRVIAIGVSTGGPNALQYVFSQLPRDFPGCLLVVQHMPEGFTETFARRLNECSLLEVKEAQSGDLLLAGRALICPGNRHMKVRHTEHGDIVVLDDQAPVNGHRPSADVLFESVATELHDKGVAILMTGMGEDGASGLGAVRAAGGLTIAQSLETCVVDSMPRSAIERGFAVRIVPLQNLGNTLQGICALEKQSRELGAATMALETTAQEVAARRRVS